MHLRPGRPASLNVGLMLRGSKALPLHDIEVPVHFSFEADHGVAESGCLLALAARLDQR